MSDNSTSDDSTDTEYVRQPAVYVLARELNAANETYQGDEDMSPRFLLLPSGGAANRITLSGVLQNVVDKGTDSSYYQAEIVGPTGTFWVYAGQYQPECRNHIAELQDETPVRVSVTGKPSTFGDDGDMNISITPEAIGTIPPVEQFRWAHDAAVATISRVHRARSDNESVDSPVGADAVPDDALIDDPEQRLLASKAAVTALEAVDKQVDADAAGAADEAADAEQSEA